MKYFVTTSSEEYLLNQGLSKHDQLKGYILKVEELIKMLDEFAEIRIREEMDNIAD